MSICFLSSHWSVPPSIPYLIRFIAYSIQFLETLRFYKRSAYGSERWVRGGNKCAVRAHFLL